MRLGISVYPDVQSLNEIKQYIKLASNYNFTRVFSSMWSVDGTKEEVLNYFKELIQIVHEYNMQVSLDVNPDCLHHVGASFDNLKVFKDLDVDVLRMDICFGLDKDVILVNNPYGIKIEFNATVMDSHYIDSLIKMGAQKNKILVCHNFYPQRYTGMKCEKYLHINSQFKKIGIEVAAFVTSHNEPTCGVWNAKDGLCTVEMIRDWTMDEQIRYLIAAGNIDTIAIGNACASEYELQRANEVLVQIEPNETMPVVKTMMHFGATRDRFFPQHKIKVKVCEEISDGERDILFNIFPHSDVGDSSEWIWRSRMARFLKKEIRYRKCNAGYFQPGEVVMVNENYSHYAGEVQIVLRPIVNDGTRNLIGSISEQEMRILNLIKEGEVVIFIEED